MKKWFNSCGRLVQIILLIIPIVGWIVEILVRADDFISDKNLSSLLFFILFLVFGAILAYVDLVWVLLFNHLIGAK